MIWRLPVLAQGCRMSPLLAQSGHAGGVARCPLSGRSGHGATAAGVFNRSLMTQTGHIPVSPANERLQNHSDARDRPQPIGYPAIWPWLVGANATRTIETPHAEDPNRFHYHHRRG